MGLPRTGDEAPDVGFYPLQAMTFMFAVASSFDQDLGWCVDGGVVTMFMFEGAACTLPSCNVTQGSCP